MAEYEGSERGIVSDDLGQEYLDDRRYWKIHDFGFVDEPIVKSLIKYRADKNRTEVFAVEEADVAGSLLRNGKHKPILDLDFDHTYVKSTADGHAHLYINTELSKLQWFVLMCGLRYAKIIEQGFFMWSLRRGQNFARLPWVKKKETEKGYYSYGWLFKLRSDKDS